MHRLDQLTRSFVAAVRSMRRSAGFTIAVVSILGVSIGMSIAMLAVVRGVLVERLPVRDQDRILVLSTVRAGVGELDPNVADLEQFKHTTRTLSGVAWIGHGGAYAYPLLDGERRIVMSMAQVSGNFFAVLGVRPALGRLLRPEDDVKGAEGVTVISYSAWQQHFDGDRQIIGHRLMRPGFLTYTIVGVAPPGLDYPAHVDYWVPTLGTASAIAIGRLAPGRTLEAARAEFLSTMQSLNRSFYGDHADVHSLSEEVLGEARPMLLVLTAAVGLLLLIACVNVGNLLFLRAAARQREIAIRKALGATYGEVARLLLAESSIIAILGGLLGLALAEVALKLVVDFAPMQLPRTDVIGLGGVPIGVAVGVTVFSVLLFGVAPSLASAKTVNLASTLRLDARSGGESFKQRRARRWLVSAQVALAVLMLAGAALLARTLQRLEMLDLGYSPEHLSFIEISTRGQDTFDKNLALSDEIIARVHELPGVTAATPVLLIPFLGTRVWLLPFEVEHTPAATAERRIPVEAGGVEYFKTLGIPVLRGRGFSQADREGAPAVVVVSQGVSRMFWPGADPIGKRLRISWDTTWRTVVGVVGDTHLREMRERAPMVYFPAQQSFWQGTLAVRTRAPFTLQLSSIQHAVQEVDPELWVWRARTMDDFLAAPLAKPRISALLLTVFGLVALSLAAVGLYGAMSFIVRMQVHEIGVRMALGASPEIVRRDVLKQALKILVPGAIAGLGCALAASRGLTALLFQVSPTDPLALSSAAVVLMLVGLGAAYIPARRATKVDPVIVLTQG